MFPRITCQTPKQETLNVYYVAMSQSNFTLRLFTYANWVGEETMGGGLGSDPRTVTRRSLPRPGALLLTLPSAFGPPVTLARSTAHIPV